MSKFNKKNSINNMPNTINMAGGTAYSMSTKLEITNLILTCLLQESFYETDKNKLARLESLFEKLPEQDKDFLGKLSIYARKEHGLRSISHVCASLISKLSGLPWLTSYYDKIINRVDDMSEIISLIYSEQDKKKSKHKLPCALKKGFAKAFNRFNDYQLAKYKNDSYSVKLVDIVNLVHPLPNERNQKALNQLINHTLKQTETWNAKLIEATKNIQADSKEEKEQKKKQAKKNVWSEFVNKDNIEYMALLKNLRNIQETGDEHAIERACQVITDEYRIKTSKVLPFRYLVALKNVNHRQIIIALNKALDICLNNIPKLSGKTLIALDTSYSMTQKLNNGVTINQIGALFAAALFKSNNCDLITYDDNARWCNLNPTDSIDTLVKQITFTGGGTNLKTVFDYITSHNLKYDRIIILSDMQSWGHRSCMGYYSNVTLAQLYNKYKSLVQTPNCKLYSFDLTGYGTCLFPEKYVYNLCGLSDKIFDVMAKLDKDQNALVHEIEKIQI